jgi:hypothetical protein
MDSSQVELAKPKVEPAMTTYIPTCKKNLKKERYVNKGTFPRVPGGPLFLLSPPK